MAFGMATILQGKHLHTGGHSNPKSRIMPRINPSHRPGHQQMSAFSVPINESSFLVLAGRPSWEICSRVGDLTQPRLEAQGSYPFVLAISHLFFRSAPEMQRQSA